MSTNVDNEIKKMELYLYKNAKRKKPETQLTLNVRESTSNLFPLFRISCLHPLELYKNINFEEKILVESAKGKTIFGQEIEYKLLNYQDINLTLSVPEQ